MRGPLSYTQYKKNMKRLIRNDAILIAVIAVVTVVFALVYFGMQKDGGNAHVIKNGKEIAVYSLNENMTVPITDENNTNVLVIENGKAYISHADCPDKICVNHRPVSKTGETIVCLPAKLVVEIGE